MNQTELGIRIKQCRKMQRLTQENLAELIDVSPHYIYEIEKGLKCMSLATLVDISATLNIPTDYLLFGTHTSTTPSPAGDIEFDRLTSLLKNLTPQQRDNLADILAVLIPRMK